MFSNLKYPMFTTIYVPFAKLLGHQDLAGVMPAPTNCFQCLD
jgi:hypothetical protein